MLSPGKEDMAAFIGNAVFHSCAGPRRDLR
jgi:hypothetical protein